MTALKNSSEATSPELENVEDIYPLTPLQEGMVFHAIAEPGTPMHVGRIVCQLKGTLDTEALRAAFDHVLTRHAALRTGFVWEGLEVPMQVVRKTVTMPFEHHDWTTLTAEDAEKQFSAKLWQDAVIGFDLKEPPLGQVDVFSFTSDDHRLVWACHHAVADGWSTGVVLEELLALSGSSAETLLPKPPRYRDHIAWLLKRKADDEGFWRRYLKGLRAVHLDRRDAPVGPGTDLRATTLRVKGDPSRSTLFDDSSRPIVPGYGEHVIPGSLGSGPQPVHRQRRCPFRGRVIRPFRWRAGYRAHGRPSGDDHTDARADP